MTGYLQRLVTAAVQGQAGIHPVVRPPATGRGAGEPAPWTELVADAAPRRGGATASPGGTPVPDLTAPASRAPVLPAARDRRQPDTFSAPPPASAPDLAPELATPLFEPAPASRPAAAAPAARAESGARPPVAHRPLLPPDDATLAARVRARRPEPSGSGREPAKDGPGPAALPPVRREPQQLAGRAASQRSSRAPDGNDIEIHIGRIEVTAVTAPPVAQAAKAARKSINLGDYLRNGR
jgi:hypothetical protein